MRLANVVILSWISIAAGQNNYSTVAPLFLDTVFPNTPLPQGKPWGARTVLNCDPYNDYPDTGVIRRYDFTISKQKGSPDGYTQEVMLINGQFPGPLIEANWGDTIQVTVHNGLQTDGTSLHWHGLLQKESQWMDGVPGVSQCPIAPGQSFTYSFIADLYGTTWYHSHYSAQYSQGLVGPLIIHGPDIGAYDIDIGPVMLSDWYHKDYKTLIKQVVSNGTGFGALVFSDNNLINGKNNFNCSTKALGDTAPCVSNAGISRFQFTPGKTHRLRLINAGAEGLQKFTIDGHTMTVIANDFVPVVPYDTQVVTLGVGQRADVLVKSPKTAKGAYMMRSSMGPVCSLTIQPDATAVVVYGRIDSTVPMAQSSPWPAWVDSQIICKNDELALTVPLYPIKPDPTPEVTQVLDINLGRNETGFWEWTINNSSFRANFNNPVLLLSNLGNNSYPDSPQWNVYNFKSASSVRFVINNPTGATHPMHLHGHNFFVLSSGPGVWDGTIVNPNNPQRRDVQMLEAGGYVVLQMTSDNPGAWPLHCHVAWHVSAGLYITVLERPDDIKKLRIPSVVAQTCRDWAAFTGKHVVDQIDSGL